MSIEVTCRRCGEEFDSRHEVCPVCGDDGQTLPIESQLDRRLSRDTIRLPREAASPERPARRMNMSERKAWRMLLELGARICNLGGKRALDLRKIRLTSQRNLSLFCSAFLEVAGRTGANRRHVNRTGLPIFIVTDDPTAPIA